MRFELAWPRTPGAPAECRHGSRYSEWSLVLVSPVRPYGVRLRRIEIEDYEGMVASRCGTCQASWCENCENLDHRRAQASVKIQSCFRGDRRPLSAVSLRFQNSGLLRPFSAQTRGC